MAWKRNINWSCFTKKKGLKIAYYLIVKYQLLINSRKPPENLVHKMGPWLLIRWGIIQQSSQNNRLRRGFYKSSTKTENIGGLIKFSLCPGPTGSDPSLPDDRSRPLVLRLLKAHVDVRSLVLKSRFHTRKSSRTTSRISLINGPYFFSSVRSVPPKGPSNKYMESFIFWPPLHFFLFLIIFFFDSSLFFSLFIFGKRRNLNKKSRLWAQHSLRLY